MSLLNSRSRASLLGFCSFLLLSFALHAAEHPAQASVASRMVNNCRSGQP